MADAIAAQAANLVRDSSAEELVGVDVSESRKHASFTAVVALASARRGQPGVVSTFSAAAKSSTPRGGLPRRTLGPGASIMPATALRNGRAQDRVEQATAASDTLRLHGCLPDGSPAIPVSTAFNTAAVAAVAAARDMENMLREMDTTLSDVRARHNIFMAGGGTPGRSSAMGGRNSSMGNAAGQSGGGKASSAEAAVRTTKPITSSTVQRGRPSLAQQHAENKFQDIDQGLANREDVFMAIPSAARRIRSRADYFRTRENLILPPIEESFMMQENGATIVNIAKLRSCARHHLVVENAPSLPDEPSPLGEQSPRTPRQAGAEPKAEGGVGEQAAAAAVVASTELAVVPQLFSAQPSIRTLSPSASMESLTQRLERLAFRAQVRDQRIQHVRDAGRQQTLNQRLVFLDHLESKQARREVNDRLRVILPWMVLATVMEWSSRVVSSFAATYSAARGDERFALVVHPLAHWRTSLREYSGGDSVAGLRHGLAALPTKTWQLLAEALRRKNKAEVLALRRDIAWKAWRRLLLLTRFLAMVLRLRRLNHQAEIVKDFIEASYRGYSIRSSVKIYIYKVLFVQQVLRNALRLRRHIRTYIIRPAVWEVETLILAPVCGIPESATRQAIDQHHKDLDPRSRLQEVRVLSQAFRGDSISLARQAALAGTSKKMFLQQPGGTASTGKLSIADRPRNSGTSSAPTRAVATVARTANSSASKRFNAVARSKGVSRSKSFHSGATVDGKQIHHGNHELRRATGAVLPCIAEQKVQSCVLPRLDRFGRASPPHRALASQVPGTVDVLDKYRLPAEARSEVERQILRENVELWLTRFQEYKAGLKRFGQEWRRWRLETASLGPKRRDEWPTFPHIPYYPSQLAKVDHAAAHVMVHELLRHTEVGKAL